MGKSQNIAQLLKKDIRFIEGLKACMNCGICTAICPAANTYDYDPRVIVSIVQDEDNESLVELLKSEQIWYCGQCMSCKTRCPRGNWPGAIIMVLRKLSQELGYFTESEKGRQQLLIKRGVGHNILKYGYCIHPSLVVPESHPEQGPVWQWIIENMEEVYNRMEANLNKEGAGTLREIPPEALKEIHNILEMTGAKDLFEKIESYSLDQARKMGLSTSDDLDEYVTHISITTEKNHNGC